MGPHKHNWGHPRPLLRSRNTKSTNRSSNHIQEKAPATRSHRKSSPAMLHSSGYSNHHLKRSSSNTIKYGDSNPKIQNQTNGSQMGLSNHTVPKNDSFAALSQLFRSSFALTGILWVGIYVFSFRSFETSQGKPTRDKKTQQDPLGNGWSRTGSSFKGVMNPMSTVHRNGGVHLVST